MTMWRVLSLTFLLLLAVAVLGQTPTSGPAKQTLTPAEQGMARARDAIANGGKQYQPYNALAQALIRRARETSDVSYYNRAEEPLRQSLALAPRNFDAQKIEVQILLGRHEFAEARDLAKTLNRQTPDDVMVYGYLADSNSALGDYEDAEKATNWMMRLRPGNVPSLVRGAYLRKVFGDVEGAIELLNQAYDKTPPNEVEERAWILTQMADLRLLKGQVDKADRMVQQAAELFPGYDPTLEMLARVRSAQHKYIEAAETLREQNQTLPSPQTIYSMAAALERANRIGEARTAYSDFEERARRQVAEPRNANRELVFYYVDHAHNPSEALRVAELEAAKRHDVFTLDAYAWALWANGQYKDARVQIDRALATGIRDAQLFYHAGKISYVLKEQAASEHYLRESLDLNPSSEVSAAAREALEKLSSPAVSADAAKNATTEY
jgi:tetratricopeptide (TPR) repeat protein